jgi:hypothetical protein
LERRSRTGGSRNIATMNEENPNDGMPIALAQEIARQGEARLAAIMALATAADLRATTLCGFFGASSVAAAAAVLASIASGHGSLSLSLAGGIVAFGLFSGGVNRRTRWRSARSIHRWRQSGHPSGMVMARRQMAQPSGNARCDRLSIRSIYQRQPTAPRTWEQAHKCLAVDSWRCLANRHIGFFFADVNLTD